MPDWTLKKVRKRALGLESQGLAKITGERKDSNDDPEAGFEIHNSATNSRSGNSIPAGTFEIWAEHIEFSKVGGGSSKDVSFTASNLSVSDTTPNLGDSVTISADITNNGSDQGTQFVPLKEDDQVTPKELTVGANSTKSISFTRTYNEFRSITVQILDSGTQTIELVGPGVSINP